MKLEPLNLGSPFVEKSGRFVPDFQRWLARLQSAEDTRTIGITIDGGGSVLTTGVKKFIRIPILQVSL